MRRGLVFHPCGHQTPIPGSDRHVDFPCGPCRAADTRPRCSNLDCPLASTLFEPNSGLCAYCASRQKETL